MCGRIPAFVRDSHDGGSAQIRGFAAFFYEGDPGVDYYGGNTGVFPGRFVPYAIPGKTGPVPTDMTLLLKSTGLVDDPSLY